MVMWFPSGSIPDAIAESRRLSRLFVVYISGDDEDSKKMDGMWEDERVNNLCNNTCVALKLAAGSEGCKQFSAIYPVLTIPSAYFIDSTGKIVEALAVQSTADEFVSKIEAVTKPYSKHTEDAACALQSGEKSETNKPNESAASDASSKSVSGKEPPASQKKETKKGRKPIQERVEEEAKEETRQEKERREWGRNMHKLKEAQREAKMKQDLEERKRDKLEEMAAKERVKRQIEQDKLDRAGRFQQEKNERAQAATKALSEKEKDEKREKDRRQQERNLFARLQFRMPDGSTLVKQFDSTDVLQSAAEYIIDQNYSQLASVQSFDLSVAFPRKTFPLSDYSRTFAELDLVPSASLVVLPRQDMTSVSSAPALFGGVWSLLMFILMIPGRILILLWNFIAGQPTSQQQETSALHDEASSNTQLSDRQRVDDSSTEIRRRRNMTRLGDIKRDDDDDNATWNGNSTQQM